MPTKFKLKHLKDNMLTNRPFKYPNTKHDDCF